MNSGRTLPDYGESKKPLPDIAICATCGWSGHVSKCEVVTEQDGWEAPPYSVHLCPICEDGGCIDDYEYSKEQNIAVPT